MATPTTARSVRARCLTSEARASVQITRSPPEKGERRSPHEALYFYWDRELQAVRSGKWKLHFPHTYRTMTEKKGGGGQPGEYRQAQIELSLYDLETDPGETKNVASEHADVVERMTRLADDARRDMGDSLQRR